MSKWKKTHLASLDLLVPGVDPVVGAERLVRVLELLARLKFLSLGGDALLVVNEVLPAGGFGWGGGGGEPRRGGGCRQARKRQVTERRGSDMDRLTSGVGVRS